MNTTLKHFLHEDKRCVFFKIEGGENEENSTLNKEIILLVDISASMRDVFNSVKASLKSFKDVIDDDIPVSIITFNDEARHVDQDIDTLEARGKTNISAALNLAFDTSSDDKMTWIILFSDGSPNLGITSKDGFKSLVAMKSRKTKIVCAGFKKKSPSSILAVIGDFIYVKTERDIDPFFKSVAFEIITTTHVNFICKFHRLPDTVFKGSSFSCVFEYSEEYLQIEYIELKTNQTKTISLKSEESKIDDEIKNTIISGIMYKTLLEMKNMKNSLSKVNFDKYRNTIMKMMRDFGNRGKLIEIQSAFDLLENLHEYENLLNIEKTQSFVNRSQTLFIESKSSLPPRYSSVQDESKLIRTRLYDKN